MTELINFKGFELYTPFSKKLQKLLQELKIFFQSKMVL
jgi:hypothetical protein